MYWMRTIWAGDYCLVKKCTPKGFGAPLKQRIKRHKETPETMIKYNNQKRAEKIQLLILANFKKGYHATLDYPKEKRPETYEEAEKNLQTTLYKVSRRLKRQGKQFKYIAVTERGKKAAALHHHLIIERDEDVVHELFEIWGDRIHLSVMYDEGQYKDLAEYLVKIETKEEQTKGRSKYHRSRNLKKPLEKSGLCSGSFDEEPMIPEGYEYVEGTLRNGINEVIGIRYQHYMLKKLPDMRPCPAGNGKEDKKCIKRESIFTRLKNKLFRRHHEDRGIHTLQ